MGKYAKATFHEKENWASEILRRFHSDMCGPFSIASNENHKYYVICVDDFSRNYWSYFIRRTIRHSKNVLSSKHWWRKTLGSMWRLLGPTMVVSTYQMNSRTFATKKEFRESWLCLITHIRMGSQKEIIEQLWVQHEQCCMIRAHCCICGQRHLTQRYLCRIIVLNTRGAFLW